MLTALLSGTKLALYVDYVGVAGNATTLIFTGTATGVTITPFNYGSDIHTMLIYMRDVRGCTLIERTNSTLPSAPTVLSASNQTPNTVDLNLQQLLPT